MRAPITGLSQSLVDAMPVRSGAQIFAPHGMLAVLPAAIGQAYETPNYPALDAKSGPVAVVQIRGVLMHHEGYFDSYDAIKSRIAAALASPAKCLLLSIDGPGGLLAGCFDCVSECRALAVAAGKKIYTYIDSMACSADYALALIGERIFIPSTGIAGSIGVIETLMECTGADAQFGMGFKLITSGARKADTNPHVPISDAAVAAMQREVDGMAALFHDLVATYRPITAEQVKAMEAGVFHGADAIAAGLADQLATEDEVIALLSSAEPPEFSASNEASKTTDLLPMTSAELKKAAQAIIDDEKSSDEDKSEAKKMLAACDEPPKKEEAKAEAEEDHKEPDEDNKGGPSDHDEDNKDEDKTEGKKAVRSVNTQLIDVARTALLATRQDFTPAQRATLKRAPLATVQDAVENWPKANVAAPAVGPIAGAIAALGAQSPVQPTVENQRQPLSAYEQATLDRLRPTVADKPYTDLEGYHRVPACTPAKQAQLLARLEGRKV